MAPILRLTFAKKEEIEIEGVLYPVKGADSISLETGLVQAGLQSKMETAQKAIAAGETPSRSDIAALTKMATELCQELIEAPKKVTDRLTDFQRMAVLKSVFRPPARKVAAPAKRKSTSKPSRRSKGSTAAGRKAG